MPLYDHECPHCGMIFEAFAEVDQQIIPCPHCCGIKAKRVISWTGAYTSNQDADWIRSVREVVDKDGGPHCQEFLKDPTRDNYRKWMKGEGLRPLEPGEKPMKPEPVSFDHLHKKMQERGRERNRLTVRSDKNAAAT